MTVSIKINAKSKKVLADLKNHNQHFRTGIVNALHEIGEEVVSETRKLIKQGPKTGRIYRIKGREHQASAPGESPANLSGRLKDSVDYHVHSEHKMEVGENAPYAKFLEDGTKNIQPRPHLIKSVHSTARTAQRALGAYVAEEIGI